MSFKPQAGEFCWNDLMTSKVGAAKEFYQNLLGWTYQEIAMENNPEGSYVMAHCGEKPVGGIMKMPSEEIPSHWMGYIYVDHLESTLEKAVKLGATVVTPITEVKGYGRLAVLQDPAGAHISFWQSTNQSTASN